MALLKGEKRKKKKKKSRLFTIIGPNCINHSGPTFWAQFQAHHNAGGGGKKKKNETALASSHTDQTLPHLL